MADAVSDQIMENSPGLVKWADTDAVGAVSPVPGPPGKTGFSIDIPL